MKVVERITSVGRLTIAAGAIVFSAVTLSGCTININAPDDTQHPGMMGNESTSTAFSSVDIMFAQMMIEHHQQAVDMGTLAETRAFSPEVKALAAKIKAEQSPEIAQMKRWLTEAGAPLQMGHEMAMDGLLSAAQMNTLTNSKGADFDRLFLTGMIGHHKGALTMAQMVANSKNAEAKALGLGIISSQTEQITYMESLLSK